MTRQQQAALQRALKSCISMCDEQAKAWIAAADAVLLHDGHYVTADFRMPDGGSVHVSMHLDFRPAPPRQRPLMIEGPKR